MHQQLPVSHLGAGLWCRSRWWHTLCVDCEGENVFMRPAAVKAPLRGPALNNRIVLGLLINVKGCWGNNSSSVIRSKQRQTRGPEAQQGPHQQVHILPGCHSHYWTDSVWCGLCLCLPTCACCSCAHSWDGDNCVSVFTSWLKISLPLHLTADWFDVGVKIHLFYQPHLKKIK